MASSRGNDDGTVQFRFDEAHHWRSAWLRDRLRRESPRMHYTQRRPFEVFCIGSDTVADVRDFATRDPAACWARFDVLVPDADAVDTARASLPAVARGQEALTPVRITQRSLAELKQLASQARAEDVPLSDLRDLVYGGHLFDHLDDETCARLVRLFYTYVRPGEHLVVMALDAEWPSFAALPPAGRQALCLRREEEVRQWASGLEGAEVRVSSSEGNLVLSVRKLLAPHRPR